MLTIPKVPTCGSSNTARNRCGSRCDAPSASARSANPSRCIAPVSQTHASTPTTPASAALRCPRANVTSATITPSTSPTNGNQVAERARSSGENPRRQAPVIASETERLAGDRENSSRPAAHSARTPHFPSSTAPETPASPNVAILACNANAARTIGTVRAAPVPSPSRNPRSNSGSNFNHFKRHAVSRLRRSMRGEHPIHHTRLDRNRRKRRRRGDIPIQHHRHTLSCRLEVKPRNRRDLQPTQLGKQSRRLPHPRSSNTGKRNPNHINFARQARIIHAGPPPDDRLGRRASNGADETGRSRAVGNPHVAGDQKPRLARHSGTRAALTNSQGRA